MERPGSRGGSALAAGGMSIPQGMGGIAPPPRPMTPSARGPGGVALGGGAAGMGIAGPPPPTAGYGGGLMARQPTAMAGAGAPLGAVRPPTGFRPPTGTLVAEGERPVTQQGMMGQGGQRGGPGRQVYDKTYYSDMLRNKNKELVQVLNQMNEEVEQINRDNSTLVGLEKKFEKLSAETKELQGQLHDQNIVLDALNQQRGAEDIGHEANAQRERNAAQRSRLETVFTERNSVEQRVKEINAQLVQHTRRVEERLNQLPPAKHREFTELQHEVQTLSAEVARMEDAIASTRREAQEMQRDLLRDPTKSKAVELHDKIAALDSVKFELEQEGSAQHTPEEAREHIRRMIKADNQELARAEEQIKELTDAIRRHENKLAKLQGSRLDLSEQAGVAETADKYEELMRKEREIVEYTSHFEENKANALRQMREKKESIVNLLERISKGMGMEGNLPSQRRYREMQDELEYKKKQMQNAETTQDRLVQEKDLRQSELEKINTLEDKIKLELTSLTEKMDTMTEELTKFTRLDLLKEEAETFRKKLEKDRVVLAKRAKVLKTSMAERSTKHDAKKAQLRENDTFMNIEKLEQKVRVLQKGIHEVGDYIKSKEAETDISPMVKEITNMVDDVNEDLMRKAML